MADNMEAAYNRVTKNGNATLLLLRVRYWSRETKYGEEFDGFKWVRNPLPEWADQIGATTTQAKYAMKILRDVNLIVNCMRMHKGALTLYTRLTNRVDVIWSKGVRAKSSTPQTESALTVGAKLPGTYKKTGDTTGDTQEIPCELHSPEISQDISAESLKGNPPTPLSAADLGVSNMKKALHVKSVHQVEQAVKANALLHKPAAASAIVTLWRDEMHKLTGAYVPPLPAKQAGQLKMFAAACQPGTAEAVLRHVLKYWLEFTVKVAGDVCLKSTPDEPHIGFILQYVAIAIMVAFPPAPPKQEAPVPKVAPPTMQSIAKAVKEYPQTLEELWALPPSDGE